MPILISTAFHFVSRTTRALPEYCDDSSHLLDPTAVSATTAFLCPTARLAVRLKRGSKIACKMY